MNSTSPHDPDYDTTLSPQCVGTVTAKTNPSPVCTITNNDKKTDKGTITVLKYLINDNGGTKEPWDFTIHVLLNLPNNETTLVASSLNNTGIEHAVLVPLVKVPGTGKSLYHADFDGSVNGTNPFTGNQDSVSEVTDLMLRNPSQSPLNFDDQHGGTITLVLSRPDPSLNLKYSLVDIETLKLGRAEFPSNGTIVLADVSPMQVLSGHERV